MAEDAAPTNECSKYASACVSGYPVWLKCLLLPGYIFFFAACWSTKGDDSVRIAKWMATSVATATVTTGVTYQATRWHEPTSQPCDWDVLTPPPHWENETQPEILPSAAQLHSNKTQSLKLKELRQKQKERHSLPNQNYSEPYTTSNLTTQQNQTVISKPNPISLTPDSQKIICIGLCIAVGIFLCICIATDLSILHSLTQPYKPLK